MLGKDLTIQKVSVVERFLELVDGNPSPWCNILLQSEVLPHGGFPNVDDTQYEYKCSHSVLYEFNCTLEEEGMGKISVVTFHSWLKQHRS